MNVNELQKLKIKELADLAGKLNIEGSSGMNKQELIVKILEAQTEKDVEQYSRYLRQDPA